MNGHCNIFIYKDCEILPSKNFKVDSIDSYLATLTMMNETDVEDNPVAIEGEWMKHQKKLTYRIRIPVDNENLLNLMNMGLGQRNLSFEDEYNWNYLVAQNVDVYKSGIQTRERKSTKVYYFIIGKKWLSENSLELELEMDVINTLIDNSYIAPGQSAQMLSLSDKTMILREHKTRWGAGTEPDMYYPIIDFYSEGLPAQLFKKDESFLYSVYSNTELENGSFYLVYVADTNAADSAISVYLASDSLITIPAHSARGWTGQIDALNELKAWWVAAIYGSDGDGTGTNSGCSITIHDAKNLTTEESGDITLTLTSNTAVLFSRNRLFYGSVSSTGFTKVYEIVPKGILRWNFRNIELDGVYRMRIDQSGDAFLSSSFVYSQIFSSTYILGLGYAANIHGESAISALELGTITDIDRTNPLLVKIVKLPYSPIPINKFVSGFEIPENWSIAYFSGVSFLKYTGRNLTDCFENYLVFEGVDSEGEIADYTSPLNAFQQQYFHGLTKTTLRNDKYEPKLLHSDYFLQKFVYDSFSYLFRGEFMPWYDGPDALQAKILTSSAVSSNFMFEFPQMKFKNLKADIEDYSNILGIRRNNELPLYHSAYLDYIRSGINFDVKTKNRQLASSIVSGVVGIGGTIIGAAVGGPFGAAAAVSLGTGAVQKIASTIFQTNQAEQNIAQKLKSAELQGVSVSGADDVDVMSYYTGNNKAKLIKYGVSDKMKKCLSDLFHYTGYIANYQGIPDTTSRTWFNFVQAEIVLEYEQNFPQELIEELKTKYREGITFLHAVAVLNNIVWDFEQQYENLETLFFAS